MKSGILSLLLALPPPAAHAMECSLKKIATALAAPAQEAQCLKGTLADASDKIAQEIITHNCNTLLTNLCNSLCKTAEDAVCATALYQNLPGADATMDSCNGAVWGAIEDRIYLKDKKARCSKKYAKTAAITVTKSKDGSPSPPKPKPSPTGKQM